MQEKFSPAIPPGKKRPSLEKLPQHVAIIMDGNGRWANAQGLPRTQGHIQGEMALMDTLAGAIEAGVKVVSVYAFSTENWKRSPREVNFLMGYSRDVIRRRSQELNDWNVKILWSGRRGRLWKSVITELEAAAELTANNTGLIFNMCINYGGQAEIVDTCIRIAEQVEAGQIKANQISEKLFARSLYRPELPPVDLMIRSSGEQRLSNFLLWQCAYAEFMFVPEPWPEYNRDLLWRELETYAGRERRFGNAVEQQK